MKNQNLKMKINNEFLSKYCSQVYRIITLNPKINVSLKIIKRIKNKNFLQLFKISNLINKIQRNYETIYYCMDQIKLVLLF